MIRHTDHKLEIWDWNCLHLADYLCDVLGRDTVRQILGIGSRAATPHYWRPLLKAVQRWRSDGCDTRALSGNQYLMRFAGHARHVEVFENDWRRPEQVELFLQRLRGRDTVEGLLFELTTAGHFLRNKLDVEYVGCRPSPQKNGDLLIYAGDDKAIVECSCRAPRIGRTLWDKKLVDDFINSASDKLESTTDYGCARLVAIRVPEAVDWSSDAVREAIRTKVHLWAEQGRLKSTNCLYFMGYEPLSRVNARHPKATGRWLSSPVVLWFNNTIHCKYPLPKAIEAALVAR